MKKKKLFFALVPNNSYTEIFSLTDKRIENHQFYCKGTIVKNIGLTIIKSFIT